MSAHDRDAKSPLAIIGAGGTLAFCGCGRALRRAAAPFVLFALNGM